MYFVIPYLMFGRIIFFSSYIVGRVIILLAFGTIIVYFAKRKKFKYEISESEISHKKRKVRFDEIKKLTVNKAGKQYGIVLNNPYRRNSLIIPLENRSEMVKLKTLILEKSNPEKIKESKFDQLWLFYIMLAIPVIMFLISFTWNTALKPTQFQHNQLSMNNISTDNYIFEIEDIEFQDKLSEEKYYILTSKGKISIKEYDRPEKSYISTYGSSITMTGPEDDKSNWPVIDYYLTNYEGATIRYIKRGYIKAYNPVAFHSNEIEAVLLHLKNNNNLYLRFNGSEQNLKIEFSKEFSDEDILQVLASIKLKT